MNLKPLQFLPILIAFLGLFSQNVSAQCNYRLDMLDDLGDTWNGGYLIIQTGGNTYSFGLNGITDDGEQASVFFDVTDAQPLEITWVSGVWDNEVSFEIYNYDGVLIVDEAAPAAGSVFTGVGNCPDCLAPSNLVFDNIYDNRAKISWTPIGVGVPQLWSIIYGEKGFTPGMIGSGDTLVVYSPKATIAGLTEMTEYDFYIVQDCGGGDVADISQKYSFKTYFSDDVGISGVVTPVSGCDLGISKVIIQMKNFGANPQSLVPFYYSVNGEAAPIPFPNDGLYTGVLGKDSCEVVEFETLSNFVEPGEYVIKVWTEMMNDDDPANDTFEYRVLNRLNTPYAQDFEFWEGGWHVNTDDSEQSSWQFGHPAGIVIDEAANGQNAWVTNLAGDHNNAEGSYLESHCFDFDDIIEDPVIEFSIILDCETDYDGATLEMSLDGGMTWNTVGASGQGLNWYNGNNITTGDPFWTGTTAGWETARHRLNGAAGEDNVRLRFYFASDIFNTNEGVGIDDIKIYVPFSRDLAGESVKTLGDANVCGLAADKVIFTYGNFGTQVQNNYQVAYSINGGTPVVETVNQALQPDQLRTHTFVPTFNSVDNLMTIRCWVQLNGDQNSDNDAIIYVVNHFPKVIPFFEDFESGVLPQDWTSNGAVSNLNGNVSYVLTYNLYDFQDQFVHALPRYGQFLPNDSFAFDYRIVDFGTGNPTELVPGNTVRVEVSSDCGNAWDVLYTVNAINHVPSAEMQRISRSLSAYAGESLLFRFVGEWAEGNFYVDIDNVNIKRSVSNNDLDAFEGLVSLNPNPNNGLANLRIELAEADEINWQIFDIYGKAISENTGIYGKEINEQIDLSREADGVYLVRISANKQVKTLRLVKTTH